jgi:hypothetical protein
LVQLECGVEVGRGLVEVAQGEVGVGEDVECARFAFPVAVDAGRGECRAMAVEEVPLCQPGVRHDELLKRWPEGERGDRPPDEFEQPGA